MSLKYEDFGSTLLRFGDGRTPKRKAGWIFSAVYQLLHYTSSIPWANKPVTTKEI
jgi:hypothetical protein